MLCFLSRLGHRSTDGNSIENAPRWRMIRFAPKRNRSASIRISNMNSGILAKSIEFARKKSNSRPRPGRFQSCVRAFETFVGTLHLHDALWMRLPRYRISVAADVAVVSGKGSLRE